MFEGQFLITRFTIFVSMMSTALTRQDIYCMGKQHVIYFYSIELQL